MNLGSILAELNMRPVSSRDDAPNTGVVDAIFHGEPLQIASRTPEFSFCSDSQDVGVCQFGRADKTPEAWIQVMVSAPLSLLVERVIAGCADEQMPRVHAPWHVAPMQYMETVRNWAVCQSPHEAVGVISTDTAIARFSRAARPKDAIVEGHYPINGITT